MPRTSEASPARVLADAFLNAAGPEDRYAATLAMARAFNIGVITATGDEVSAGAAQSGDDLYLYDFELQAAANATTRGKLFPMTDIASTLSAMGFKSQNADLSADEAWMMIRNSLGVAVNEPSQGASLGALLVRELGLRRQDLLSTSVNASNVWLDPMQRLILTSELVRSVAVIDHLETSRPIGTQSQVVKRALALAYPTCEDVIKWGDGRFGEVSAIFKSYAEQILGISPEKVQEAARIVKAVAKMSASLAELYHAGNLTLLIDVQATKIGDGNEIHYGPPAPRRKTAGLMLRGRLV